MKTKFKAAAVIAVMAIVFLFVISFSNNEVYADTDHGTATIDSLDNNSPEEIITETETTEPKDPATKPDNGLMNLDEMYAYEPHITKDEDAIDLNELPPEELLEELEQVFNPVYSDVEPNVTAETVIESIEAVNKQRFEEAKKNAGTTTTPDVGESNYETAEVVEAPETVAATNNITSISDKKTSDSNVTVGVESYEENEEVATKTVARVYRPDGSSYEMELTTDEWNNIELDGTDGEYTINIYQCNGSGYTMTSQHIVEKETEKKSSNSYSSRPNKSSKNTEDDDSADVSNTETSSTEVETNVLTSVESSVEVSSEPTVETPSEPVAETSEDTSVVEVETESPVETTESESTETTESEDSFDETETAMTLDELLGMF